MKYFIYTYKIKTTPKLINNFERLLGATRFIYNLAKETKEEAYKKGVKLSNYDLHGQLTQCKKENDWLYEYPASTLKRTITKLDIAYNKFYKGGGYPKWASKKKWKSIPFSQAENGKNKAIRQNKDNSFFLPKFKNLKVFNQQRIKENIRNANIIKKADGWYLQVVVLKDGKKRDNENQIVALDMGIKNYYVTSDGEYQENPNFSNSTKDKLRRQQRKLDRKKKGSKNWYKQLNLLQKTYLKLKRQRQDFQHKVTNDLANRFSHIVLEELDIVNMVKNKSLAESIHDASWFSFKEKLKYKTNVIEVNPAYTSQKCSKCNYTSKQNRKTQADFKCVSCGHTANADENACQNILSEGIAFIRQREPLG